MKFVYQTKLNGLVDAPIITDNAEFALRAAATSGSHVLFHGTVLTKETEKIISRIKKTGAKLVRRGQGVNINAIADRKKAFTVLFADEIEKFGEYTFVTDDGLEIFEKETILLNGSCDDKMLTTIIIGSCVMSKGQTITLASKPKNAKYFEFALGIMKELGYVVTCDELTITTGPNKAPMTADITIDGNPDVALFGLLCSALGYDVSVTNVYKQNPKLMQLVDVFEKMGLHFEQEIDGRMRFIDSEFRKPAIIDGATCPDVLPFVCFFATQTEGETEIYNINNGMVNGGDRSLFFAISELHRLGADISAKRIGTLSIRGRKTFDGGVRFNCRENYDVALISILATLCSRKSNVLDNIDVLAEDFGDFWEMYNSIGGFTE